MKLIQVMQDSYLPDLSGNCFVLHYFHKMFEVCGYDDYIFIYNKSHRPDFEKVEGVPVYNPKGRKNDLLDKCNDVIKEEGIDILVSHSYKEHTDIDFVKEINLPKILVTHFYYKNLESIQEYFDLILVFQERYIKKYVERGVNRDKLLFFPVPRDIDLYRPMEVMKKERSILYVGRVIESKGVHLIIPYLNELDANLTIIGSQEDEEYNKFLREEISKYNVRDKVEFKGVIRGKELVIEYNKHDVFMLLSSSDCYSLVLQECILCGLPAVALQNNNNYDWTRGHVFIEDNLRMCVNRIKTILDGVIEFNFDRGFAENFSMRKLAKVVGGSIKGMINDDSNNRKNRKVGFVWNNKVR